MILLHFFKSAVILYALSGGAKARPDRSSNQFKYNIGKVNIL